MNTKDKRTYIAFKADSDNPDIAQSLVTDLSVIDNVESNDLVTNAVLRMYMPENHILYQITKKYYRTDKNCVKDMILAAYNDSELSTGIYRQKLLNLLSKCLKSSAVSIEISTDTETEEKIISYLCAWETDLKNYKEDLKMWKDICELAGEGFVSTQQIILNDLSHILQSVEKVKETICSEKKLPCSEILDLLSISNRDGYESQRNLESYIIEQLPELEDTAETRIKVLKLFHEISDRHFMFERRRFVEQCTLDNRTRAGYAGPMYLSDKCLS